jgi:hypothetical protein
VTLSLILWIQICWNILKISNRFRVMASSVPKIRKNDVKMHFFEKIQNFFVFLYQKVLKGVQVMFLWENFNNFNFLMQLNYFKKVNLWLNLYLDAIAGVVLVLESWFLVSMYRKHTPSIAAILVRIEPYRDEIWFFLSLRSLNYGRDVMG